MLYGMGTVFVFLTILVFATQAMSAIANRFSSNEDQATSSHPQPRSTNTQGTSSPRRAVVSAIEKAIAAHRDKK